MVDWFYRYENQNRMILLSIDPGISSTGWAVFVNGMYEASGVVRPAKTKASFHQRAVSIARSVDEIADAHLVEDVLIEMPQDFSGATARAAAKRGDILKLSLLVGMISYAVDDYRNIETVNVNDWKGQLTKKVCRARIRKALGNAFCSENIVSGKHDEWDAVGIGLWKLGRINQR